MEFSIKQGNPEKQRSACIVVGVREGGQLSEAGKRLDDASQNMLSAVITRGDLTGKSGSTLMLHNVPGIAAERVLLVGLGDAEKITARDTTDQLRGVFKVLQSSPAQDALLYLSDDIVHPEGETWVLQQAVLAASDSLYRSDRLKAKPATPPALSNITFGMMKKPAAASKRAVERAAAIGRGMHLARELGDLPGNVCTPPHLAERALAIGKAHKKIKTKVLERKDMEKLGMGALLAVTRGSEQAPKLITLEYNGGAKSAKPVVLVGKGITFDSGGISLKPGAEMDEMKYDMSGAASVLGTMQALAEMDLALNVVGIIPACENLPSGNATKPGDIVTSMSGQTIEILNTDAEGRLILCDALSYAARFKPATVIDIATLTGACVIALGHVASGLFSNDQDLADALLKAGQSAHDRAWQLPLWEDYQPLLDSNFADMQNIGGRAGGTITAACFLSRFTQDYRWAHLDIAGTAWRSGKEKGSTGRPVPLLAQYLIDQAG